MKTLRTIFMLMACTMMLACQNESDELSVTDTEIEESISETIDFIDDDESAAVGPLLTVSDFLPECECMTGCTNNKLLLVKHVWYENKNVVYSFYDPVTNDLVHSEITKDYPARIILPDDLTVGKQYNLRMYAAGGISSANYPFIIISCPGSSPIDG